MQGPRTVATAVDHPKMSKTDAASIQAFLRDFDQYSRKVTERERHLVREHVTSTESANPVELKFFVSSESVQAVLGVYYIPEVDYYESLSEDEHCELLRSKAVASKDVILIDKLDNIFKDHLRIDMKDKNALSRIENIFVSWKSLLRKFGHALVTTESENIAF